MKRTVRLVCCAALLSFHPFLASGQTQVSESTPVTQTATIEAIDKASRSITLKRPDGSLVQIKASDQMEGFNRLKVGDQVTATYFEAVAVSVRRPGDPAPPTEPTTTIQRKDRAPGSETRRQQTFTVTVRAVDLQVPSLTVMEPQGRIVTLNVDDPKPLQNFKVGDTVDVTYYESLLVKVSRPPK